MRKTIKQICTMALALVMSCTSVTMSSLADAGWRQNSTGWWYQTETGYLANGWGSIQNQWYLFDQAGYMLTGWQNAGGTWYYMNGSGAMLTGWQMINGNWYYMNGSGAMLTGWQMINGNWYYMYADGRMAANTVIEGYQLGASGALGSNTSVNESTPSKEKFLSVSNAFTTGAESYIDGMNLVSAHESYGLSIHSAVNLADSYYSTAADYFQKAYDLCADYSQFSTLKSLLGSTIDAVPTPFYEYGDEPTYEDLTCWGNETQSCGKYIVNVLEELDSLLWLVE